MKHLIILLVLAGMLASACGKEGENRELQPVIRGKVVDILDQKPVAGVEVMVIDFWTDGWNYGIPVAGRDTTDSEGAFEVWYTLKYPSDDRIIKFNGIPAPYQQAVRINGTDEGCIVYDYADLYSGNLFGGYRVEDEGAYKIELMPWTYARFAMPAVPEPWKSDSIELKIDNLCLPVMENSNNVCFCSYTRNDYNFPLTNTAIWQTLGIPTAIRKGNRVKVYYRIYHSGITKKYGEFEKACSFGDTTTLEMPF